MGRVETNGQLYASRRRRKHIHIGDHRSGLSWYDKSSQIVLLPDPSSLYVFNAIQFVEVIFTWRVESPYWLRWGLGPFWPPSFFDRTSNVGGRYWNKSFVLNGHPWAFWLVPRMETLLILLGIDIIAVFYPVPLVAMRKRERAKRFANLIQQAQ